MGKQPYIPIYIGDWEQDTNGLSIAAEGAWLKILFKCWKEMGVYVSTPEIVARLWKVDAKTFASLLLELKINKICEITELDNGFIKFESRRILKNIEISKSRAISGKIGGSKTQANGKAKLKQIHEYENEYNISLLTSNKGNIEERELSIRNYILEKSKDSGLPDEEIKSFINYWTEKNARGTKLRIEDEKFFDVGKRLATWKRNYEKKFKPVKTDISPELDAERKRKSSQHSDWY